MDLKETKQLIASAEIKLHTKSKNKSDSQEMYDALFSDEEQLGETNTDSKHPNKDIGKRMFGNVSTLDWIQTWRAFETN